MQYPKAICIAEASWTQIDKMTHYRTIIYGSEERCWLSQKTAAC